MVKKINKFMYNKPTKYTYTSEELSNYIEGNDIYNSSFLSIISNPAYPKITYVISEYEFRPDLIAREVYGSTSYEGLLMIQTGLIISDYTKGNRFFVWHIEDLIIYDKQRSLGEFICRKKLKRPPQSWCYVEEACNER